MKTMILCLTLFLAVGNAFAVTWWEDTDGDGRKETKFYDTDNDGIPDNASVDRDGDGKEDEYWVDEDDDGDWDRMWKDTAGKDEKWDKGFFDLDDDGDWDRTWEDQNGNNEVDPGETRPLNPEQPFNGPRPVQAIADRMECDCGTNLVEPIRNDLETENGNVLWWIGGGLLLLILIVLGVRKKG